MPVNNITSVDSDIHFDSYRLILVDCRTDHVFLRRDSSLLELPTIRIHKRSRPAEAITDEIRRAWNVSSVVIDYLPKCDGLYRSVVIEVRGGRAGLTAMTKVGIDRLLDTLTEAERAHFNGLSISGTRPCSPFCSFGWVDAVNAWIRASVRNPDLEFSDDIRQLNAGGPFCIARIETRAGQAYWIKAVGDPNKHEFGITKHLSDSYPEYLPPIVAMRDDWKAWIMEDSGQSLHASESFSDFERAVARLGQLQAQTITECDDLVQLGCRDHRNVALSGAVDELIDYLVEAMMRQTTTKAPALPTYRLLQMRDELQQLLDLYEKLNVPDSLMHNDISPGSILVKGSVCLFTDWCEAAVGSPFITFEQFCIHASRDSNYGSDSRPSLENIYRSCWRDLLSERTLGQAYRLAPVLSVLSYLYGDGHWFRSPERYRSEVLAYSRTLARHMDRALRGSPVKGGVCRQG